MPDPFGPIGTSRGRGSGGGVSGPNERSLLGSRVSEFADRNGFPPPAFAGTSFAGMTARLKATRLAEMTSFPRKRESISCPDPGRRHRTEPLGDLPLHESLREPPGLYVVSPAGPTHGFRRHDDPAPCRFLRGTRESSHAVPHEQVRIDRDRPRKRVFRHCVAAFRFRSVSLLRLPARIRGFVAACDELVQIVRAGVLPLDQQALVFDLEPGRRPPQGWGPGPCVFRSSLHRHSWRGSAPDRRGTCSRGRDGLRGGSAPWPKPRP